jgi:hypothetical protein
MGRGTAQHESRWQANLADPGGACLRFAKCRGWLNSAEFGSCFLRGVGYPRCLRKKRWVPGGSRWSSFILADRMQARSVRSTVADEGQRMLPTLPTLRLNNSSMTGALRYSNELRSSSACWRTRGAEPHAHNAPGRMACTCGCGAGRLDGQHVPTQGPTVLVHVEGSTGPRPRACRTGPRMEFCAAASFPHGADSCLRS